MYQIRIIRLVHRERETLPGAIRQRIKRIISDLAANPRPFNSIEMQLTDEQTILGWEIRRIRVDTWRIIYAVDEEFEQIAILAIRKRPPYDYEDLEELLAEL
jgi:mRNA-degrading endonuclease RelE of RelBE toxin-antitoxin system